MLQIFKINDPLRLLGVLLILILIRMLFFWSGLPTIILEIKWLTLGEKLAEGGVMYRDVWDNTPPLAAFVYKWLFIFFGKTTVPYKVISIILVFLQAAIFNNMMLKNKAYNQNTYVPALMYMLFMNISFDFFTLSPILMAMTFILLAINNLFKRMDNKSKDEMFVLMGVYFGIATLFSLPSTLYLIVTILSLLIFTGSIFRRMLLMVYGVTIIILLAAAHYYSHGALGAFSLQFLQSTFRISVIDFLSLTNLSLLMIVPFIVFLVSIIRINKVGRFINYQVKIQRVMLFFFLSGIIAIMMVREVLPFQVIYFIPAMAFFVTHYLLSIKKWLVAESTFMLIFILLIANNLFPLKNYLHIDKIVSYNKLINIESQVNDITKGKKVLVLGEGLNEYSGAKLATPYLNWQYAKNHFTNLNYYDNLSAIYTNFTEDMPEVIIDKEDIVPALFEKLPTIKSRYKLEQDAVYVLTPKEKVDLD